MRKMYVWYIILLIMVFTLVLRLKQLFLLRNLKKKYYNFHSLLLYDFQMPESNNSNNDVRWLSEYVSKVSSNHDDYSRITEYTNLLSFDVIYFRPLISMFHDLIEFTVILYED